MAKVSVPAGQRRETIMPEPLPRNVHFTTRFTVTDQHLALLRRTHIGYDAWTEFGAPEVDSKRPYGNSNVHLDLAEILGIEPGVDEDGGTSSRTLRSNSSNVSTTR